MLNWLFKKRTSAGAMQAATSLPAVHPSAETKAREAEEAKALWLERLESAGGDEAQLLRIAQSAPALDVKLAAVQALTTEAALKQAEREFRSHDRKVHQAVKSRLQSLTGQRQSRDRAQSLIEAAAAMEHEVPLAANRLVVLDKGWQSLDASQLEPAQCAAFAAIRERLDAAIREQGEARQRLQQWTAQATKALSELRVACTHAASHGTASDVTQHREAAQALRNARPSDPAAETLDAALSAALQSAEMLEVRLALLAELEHPGTQATAASAPESQADPVESGNVSPPYSASALTPAQRWRALPPLADAELTSALNLRFERWQRAQMPAQVRATKPIESTAQSKAPDAGQLARLERALQAAEAALAEGQLSAMQRPMQAVDAALESLHGAVPDDALRARHQALQAEHARLRGWQQWGGGLAREGLVEEAEELARITLAATAPQAPEETAAPAADAAPRLIIKAHGDAIHALRARWKELDRLGAAASQPMWQRFDAALQTAYQPVAEHKASLKAAREENLAARESLLAELEAVNVEVELLNADDLAAHWKEQIRTLDRFHLAWRQLGPIEHTAPAAARNTLARRWRSAIERIEAPLNEARRAAQVAREQLIERAEALVQDLARQQSTRDAVARVRELQAEWQQRARALPLVRAVEGSLWTRFKAATDAVFAQREASANARDAELAANLVSREALVARLTALTGDTPADDLQRTLTEVDRAWRNAGEVPRGTEGAIEARYREARAAVSAHLAQGEQKRWKAQCDALAAKLALCEEREAGKADVGSLDQRWAASAALPPTWEQALATRWAAPTAPEPLAASALDDLLLQIEAALDLPAAPQWQEARRDLKLRSLKDAMEGHRSQNLEPLRQADWFAAALGQSRFDESQRSRLHAIIAALSNAAPGSLLPPTRRG